jgi:hypothetical protein
VGADQPGDRERAMMIFSMVGCAQKPAKSTLGKGTTFSRAAQAPYKIWASAPEASRRSTWSIVVLLTICLGSPMIVQSQSTDSTRSRNHRAPRGCAYMKATIPITSANVAAPREFVRPPAVVGSSVNLLFETVAGDCFPATFLAGQPASVKPNWLISAPLRVTQISPHQCEVLLCGLHGVNDSQ